MERDSRVRLVGLAALLAIACAWPGLARSSERHGVERVRFWHYGVEDGLSQSTARLLLQDRDGVLWVGTQDGLNRFDGQEFKVFRNDPSDPETLPDNSVTALAGAADGVLWVGTQAGGLARYRPLLERFERYPDKPGSAPAAPAQRPITALL